MTQLQRAVGRAFEPVQSRIDAGRLPGAVIGAVAADGERAVLAAGSAMTEPDRVAMSAATIFDLASLTKVIFTTTALLELVADGVIGLDQRLAELIPDLRQYDLDAPERRLTVGDCLAHQTFLPAIEPLYTLGLPPETLEAYVLQRSWVHGPPVYSDINFILLGIVLNRVTGRGLRELPLPTGFSFGADPDRCAATERCMWRRRMIRGEVHDENAFAFGGAAGHAGLFGNADAVLGFAEQMLRRIPDPGDAMHLAIRRSNGDFSLGWHLARPEWHGGERCSARTIGHTGFTGTGLWIDVDGGVAWTLLTNRVHPTRHGQRAILDLRREVSDRLLEAL